MGNDEKRKAAAWAWYERRGGGKEKKVGPKSILGTNSKCGIKSRRLKSLGPSPVLEKSRFHAEAVAAIAPPKKEWMDDLSLSSPPTLPSKLMLWDDAEMASFEDLLHRTLVREEYLLASHIDQSPPNSTFSGSHHSCLPIAHLRSIMSSHSSSFVNGDDLGGSEALDYDLVQHPAYVPEFELCPSDNNWPKEEEEEVEEEEEDEEEYKRRANVKRYVGLLRNNWSKKEEEEEEDEEGKEEQEEEKRRAIVKRSLGLLRNTCSKEEEEGEEKRRASLKRSLGLLRNNCSKEEGEEEGEEEKRRASVKRSLGLLRNNWSKKKEEDEEKEGEEKRRASVRTSLGLLRNNCSKEEEEEEEKKRASVQRSLRLRRNNSSTKEDEEEEKGEKRSIGVKKSLGFLWRACEHTTYRLTHIDLSKAKPRANSSSPYFGEATEEESQQGHIHCHCESKQTPRRESRNSLRSLFTTQPP